MGMSRPKKKAQSGSSNKEAQTPTVSSTLFKYFEYEKRKGPKVNEFTQWSSRLVTVILSLKLVFLLYKYTIEPQLQQPRVFCPVHSPFNLSDVTATPFCQETLDIGQSSFRTHYFRGTQRQFSENICSEEIWDLEFSEHLL